MKTINEFQREYRFLSNFWPAEVTLDGVKYPSVEHAYVAAKTLDLSARHVILKSTPGQAKRYGRSLQLRSDWERVKIPIMQDLVSQKFAHPDLSSKLLETGNAELIEGNTWGDAFWGVCNGVGKNHLGKILMGVRNSLADASAAAPQVVADEPTAEDYSDMLRAFFFHYAAGGYNDAGGLVPLGTAKDKLEWIVNEAIQHASPVQAQELSDATIINAANKYGISPHAAMPFVRELIAAQSTTQEIRAVANPVEFDGIKTHAVRAQEPIGYASSNELRNLSDPGTSRLIAICASPVQPDVTVALYSAPAQPMAMPNGEEFGFKAVRLRRTAFLLGLEGAIPDNDKDLMDCMGAVLGMICREVERLAAPAAQGDAITFARYNFLRDMATDTAEISPYCVLGDGEGAGRIIDGAELDSLIDAAIAAKAAS